MNNKTYEELINEYIDCIKANYIIDYANRNAVRSANKRVDKMIKISKYISSNYPQRIYDFAELLFTREYNIDGWAAHHILENMNYSPELEAKALNVIIRYSKQDSVKGLGNRMWLQKWYANKKKTVLKFPE